MKTKLKKKKKGLFDYKLKMTYDPKLDEIDVTTLAPEKLEEANKSLKRIKNLQEILSLHTTNQDQSTSSAPLSPSNDNNQD